MALALIVVDEPDTLLALRRDLELAGHRTLLAADADTALVRLATSPVDVVALDIMMPVHDGWTVLQAIRDLPAPPPVIVVSGRAGPIDLARARRMGALRSVLAGCSAEELTSAIDAALSGCATPS